jgi:hypothetical protein
VFVTSVEAGPVALLVLGSLMFFIGVLGFAPTRLKWGDKEAEWQLGRKIGKELSEAAESLPLAERAQFVSNLASADVPSAVIEPTLSSFANTQFALTRIMRALPEGASIDGEYRVGPAVWDLALLGRSGSRVLVETKIGRGAILADSIRLLKQKLRLARQLDPSVKGALLVTTRAPTADALRALADEPDLHLVEIRRGEQPEGLADLLASMLT